MWKKRVKNNILEVFMKINSSLVLTLVLLFSSPALSKIPSVEPGKPLPSDLFVELNKAVNPAVVNISTEIKPKPLRNYGGRSFQSGDPMEELLKQFFGGGMGQGGIPMRSRPAYSLGTGFIIRKDGLILTNSHVVDQADIINVQLTEKDETSYPATVIGKDPKTDIALIKIKAPKELPTVKLGSSDKLQVGEWVAAFGNPFGHGHSMSKGIVSAIGRDIDEINLFPFIQTDASINPGNSGGPLVNTKGEVIGVNTAIDARAQGIGFAIPIDEVKPLISQLEKNGRVQRGFLGVEMATMNEVYAQQLGTKQETGALVVNVLKNSAADKAGVKPYDIITKFDSADVKTSADLARAVSRSPIGKTNTVTVLRNNKTIKLKAKLGSNTNDKKVAQNKMVYPDKKTNKKTASPLLNKFGLEISNLTPEIKKEFEISNTDGHRAYVSKVIGFSKASNAGLREGDVIFEINRDPVINAKEAEKILLKNQEGFLIRAKRGDSFLLIRL